MREYLLNPKKDKEAANNKDSNKKEAGGNHLVLERLGPKNPEFHKRKFKGDARAREWHVDSHSECNGYANPCHCQKVTKSRGLLWLELYKRASAGRNRMFLGHLPGEIFRRILVAAAYCYRLLHFAIL